MAHTNFTTSGTTTDIDALLAALAEGIRQADEIAAGRLSAEASFDVGCMLAGARGSIQKARDLLRVNGAGTVVHSAKLDKVYSEVDELFA